MFVHYEFYDKKAEAVAKIIKRQDIGTAEEFSKEVFLFFKRNAATMIFDLNYQMWCIFFLDYLNIDIDGGLLGRIADSVVDEALENLGEVVFVAFDSRDLLGEFVSYFDAFFF